MTCETCSSHMVLNYDVVERDTLFVLWECGCGHKYLERRPSEVLAATAQA